MRKTVINVEHTRNVHVSSYCFAQFYFLFMNVGVKFFLNYSGLNWCFVRTSNNHTWRFSHKQLNNSMKILCFAYRKDNEIPIYTCSSAGQKPIKWSEFIEMNRRHGIYWPTIRAIWYSSFWVTNNPLLYAVLNFFCHIVPGYILDTLSVFVGKKPM